MWVSTSFPRWASGMSQLEDIGAQDGWRCWVCDESVDRATSPNDPRGPSVDSRTASPRSAKKAGTDFAGGERLAHRACNTRKGAVAAVVRCADRADADRTADWLVDRFSRLAPALHVVASVDPGGGQFLVALTVARRR